MIEAEGNGNQNWLDQGVLQDKNIYNDWVQGNSTPVKKKSVKRKLEGKGWEKTQ